MTYQYGCKACGTVHTTRMPVDSVHCENCWRSVEVFLVSSKPQTSTEPNAEYFTPSAEWIEQLQEGDFAPDCFGNLNAITRIHARGLDIEGRAYVCFYTRFSETSTMSGSFKAGELHRTMGICSRHTSNELDLIERGA